MKIKRKIAQISLLLMMLINYTCVSITIDVNAEDTTPEPIPIETVDVTFGETSKEYIVKNALKIEPSILWSDSGLYEDLTSDFGYATIFDEETSKWIQSPYKSTLYDIDGDGISNDDDLDIDGDGVSNIQERLNLKGDVLLGAIEGDIHVNEFINEDFPVIMDASPCVVDTPSGGSIILDTGSTYINPDQIIYYPYPQKYNDKDGTQYDIYRASFPFEFEFNIYTVYDYEDVNPAHGAGTFPDQEDTEVCVGRLYIGDALAGDGQTDGYRYDARDYININTPIVGKKQGVPVWYPDSEQNIELKYKDGDTDFPYYNDGHDSFETKHEYYSYPAYIPYIELGHSRYDGLNFYDNDFNVQKNAMIEYSTSDEVDIGFFGVSFRLKLDPFVLGDIEYSGDWADTSTLEAFSNTKLVIESADMLEVYPDGTSTDRGGYLGVMDTEMLNEYFFDDIPKSIDDIEGASPLASAPEMPHKGLIGQGVDFTLAEVPITTSYSSSDVFGGDTVYSSGQPRLYSNDINKYLIDFTAEDQRKFLQYQDWQMELTGFHLTPRVQLVKKVSAINYIEEFWDKDVLNDDPFFTQASMTTVPKLAGWNVINNWLGQRVRVWVGMYARIPIDQNFIGQSTDAGDQSHLGDPTNPIGMRMWDTSTYGTVAAQVTNPNALNNLGLLIEDFFEWLSEWKWIIVGLIIAGLVALTIIFSSGGGSNTKAIEKAIEKRDEIYDKQIRALQESNFEMAQRLNQYNRPSNDGWN
ncbi:MAG: hypothetical protein WC934_02775 [Acidithiobacillus sp.]|jgi:hypothetical protein|uniref:hypothetical protein n=1 Tax=Acidithiobacillus sp. TaxID=1872118 RepID=UPI00355CC529